MARRASLRIFQRAVRQFLEPDRRPTTRSVDDAAHLVLDFWAALVEVLPEQWRDPRKHMLTEGGVGVYALMEIAADIYRDTPINRVCDRKYFVAALSDFALEFDWSTNGPFKGLGGQSGVKKAVELIRTIRRNSRLKVVRNGK